MISSREVRPLIPLGYGIAFLLLIGPAIDFAVATYPWSPDLVSWRFGALGLLGNALLLPTLALAILAITAGALQHRRVLQVLAVVAGVGSVLLLMGLLLLALDALQLRRNVRADSLPGYDFGAIRVALNYLLAVGFGLWVAISARKSARALAGSVRRKRTESEEPAPARLATPPRPAVQQ